MAEFVKQDTVNDQYFISTTQDESGNYSSVVFGYHSKKIMWSKVYKRVTYTTQKEAEEGHKQLKQEFA
jgi:cyclophilin family peptidyl-prolyl cis-trans isomerase